MILSTFLRPALLAVSLIALAGCDSAEERAEKHYQNALSLLESGDVDRAFVEFRNVFALNDGHRDARTTYAEAARAQGNISEAYVNYLRVVEQFPDDHQSRLALAQMAILNQNWDEAERHGAALIEAQAEVEGIDVADLALQFRQSVLDEDRPRMREITQQAEQLLKQDPEDRILLRILIEGYRTDGRFEDALKTVDQAIALSPTDSGLYRAKSQLLHGFGENDALEAHLRDTIAQFPADETSKRLLLRLLSEEGKFDEAESFIRAEIEKSETPENEHVGLITYLGRTKGADAATAEVEAAIASYENNRIFRALKAGMMFDQGQRDDAVSLMQELLDGADASDENNRYRVTLAKMLQSTDNVVGARQLVEQVLANDATQVDALKMSATWLIEADDTDQAVNVLRTALDQEPEDSEAMTIMARAYQRAGNMQLAQDLLSLAVEASRNAPNESLRFARLLIDQERYRPAEEVLINSLRRAPGHFALLQELGQLYLKSEDWARAQQVVETLRRNEDEASQNAAQNLQVQILARKNGRESAIEFLEGITGGETGNLSASIALIRARLAEGNAEEALEIAKQLRADNPDDPRTELILGSAQFASRDFEAAENTFRNNFDASKTHTAALQLMRVLMAQGRSEDARNSLDDALQQLPGNPNLLWAKASFLEQSNDIDGAIGIYEELYAQNSNSLVVANNLASLLATYRDDDESLERAFTVARRLRGTEVPALQDTYGWILYRRGEFEEAKTYLEPSAARLENDPIVQFHLAKVYQSLGQDQDAAEYFKRAVDVADKDDPRSQIAEAREMLAKSGSE